MFVCDTCGKQLKTPQGLSGHRRFAHSETGPSSSVSNVASGTADSTGGSSSQSLALGERIEQLEQRLGERIELLEQQTELQPLTAEQVALRVAEQVVEQAAERLRAQVTEAVGTKAEEIGNIVAAEWAPGFDELRRQTDQNHSDIQVLSRFLVAIVMPAIERRLPDDPQGALEIEGLVVHGGEPDWERARCGHFAPRDAASCDSLLCVAKRLVAAKTGGLLASSISGR